MEKKIGIEIKTSPHVDIPAHVWLTLSGQTQIVPRFELRPNRLIDQRNQDLRMRIQKYRVLRNEGQNVDNALIMSLRLKSPCPLLSTKWPWKYLNKILC